MQPIGQTVRVSVRTKRALDIVASLLGLIVFSVPIALVALAVVITSRGPALYWSDRVGRDNRVFRMPKFRTMRTHTPQVATHLLTEPDHWLTPIGGFLRKSSLDELPQLWSILVGDMSVVGPRPALFNEHELIALRTARGVQRLRPGLTGWAQVNGRDRLALDAKVELDEDYLRLQSLYLDGKIVLMTVQRVICRHDITH